jgi:hypothetical protein
MPAKTNGKDRGRDARATDKTDKRPDDPPARVAARASANGSARSNAAAEPPASPTQAVSLAAPLSSPPPAPPPPAADAPYTDAPFTDPPSAARAVSDAALDRLSAAAAEPGVGGAFLPDPTLAGAVGFTHFDTPTSEDDAITVLLPKEAMARLPAQSLVRIRSPRDPADGDAADAADTRDPGPPGFREYLGVVVAGPFAEPDGLGADSSLVVATTVSGNGRVLLPRYHGRALVQLVGEIERDADGEGVADAEAVGDRGRPQPVPNPRVFPPRHRPRPNSAVFPLDDADTPAFLKVGGGRPADARLGVMVGRDRVAVPLPTDRKHVLPRHTGILGTTGGGKSTTVATLLHGLAAAGVATVVIDVEGEYTEIDRPAADPAMRAALRRRGLAPAGVGDLHVLHPIGRETSRSVAPDSPAATSVPAGASGPAAVGPAAVGRVHPFSLLFSELSPHAVTELLEMPDAQQERFLKAFDVARVALREFGVFPTAAAEEEQFAALDELETGYPRMTLDHLIDVCDLFARVVGKDESEPRLRSPAFADKVTQLRNKVAAAKSSHEFSWRGLLGRLHRVNRLKIFDNPAAAPLRYGGFLEPGRVSVVDLSDTDEPQVRNLVIADVLRGIQRAQDRQVAAAQAADAGRRRDRGGPRVPECPAGAADADAVPPGRPDRPPGPQAVARPRVRHPAPAAPAGRDPGPPQQLHDSPHQRRRRRRPPPQDGGRPRPRAVAAGARPGPWAGGRVADEPHPPARRQRRPRPLQAAARRVAALTFGPRRSTNPTNRHESARRHRRGS